MAQPLRIQSRPAHSPMRTRRIGVAVRPGTPPARREPVPAINLAGPRAHGASRLVGRHAVELDLVGMKQVAKVSRGTAAAPALRGKTNSALPTGASAGTRQVAAEGNTVGTGAAVIGSGSSVGEGIASNRGVLGSP